MWYDEAMNKKKHTGHASKKQNKNSTLIAGTMQKHKKGFGFLLPDEGDDIFIPWSSMNGAMNGDRVEVRFCLLYTSRCV